MPHTDIVTATHRQHVAESDVADTAKDIADDTADSDRRMFAHPADATRRSGVAGDSADGRFGARSNAVVSVRLARSHAGGADDTAGQHDDNLTFFWDEEVEGFSEEEDDGFSCHTNSATSADHAAESRSTSNNSTKRSSSRRRSSVIAREQAQSQHQLFAYEEAPS